MSLNPDTLRDKRPVAPIPRRLARGREATPVNARSPSPAPSSGSGGGSADGSTERPYSAAGINQTLPATAEALVERKVPSSPDAPHRRPHFGFKSNASDRDTVLLSVAAEDSADIFGSLPPQGMISMVWYTLTLIDIFLAHVCSDGGSPLLEVPEFALQDLFSEYHLAPEDDLEFTDAGECFDLS